MFPMTREKINYGPTDRHSLLYRCVDSSKNQTMTTGQRTFNLLIKNLFMHSWSVLVSMQLKIELVQNKIGFENVKWETISINAKFRGNPLFIKLSKAKSSTS